MVFLPIIGAFLEASGVILEKKILKNRRMNYKNYTVYSFLAIILVMSLFIYFVWNVEREALLLKNILIFAFIIVVSIFANLFIFYSLKRENISEFEPAWLMQPLFTVLLAVLFFQSERNWIIFILALVASSSLVISHVKRHHLYFNKYLIAALIGSFLFAVELVTSKLILEFYSPFSLYYIRSFFIFAITALVYRPKFKEFDKKTGAIILLIGLMWAFYRAIIYYAYGNIGILLTTIIFILSPVLMLVFAVIFLKETPSRRQIVSTLIILACVIVAIGLSN